MSLECPNCHKAYLVCDEIFDTEWYDNSYNDNCIGHCPECNKVFQWVEEYRFVAHRDIKQINE